MGYFHRSQEKNINSRIEQNRNAKVGYNRRELNIESRNVRLENNRNPFDRSLDCSQDNKVSFLVDPLGLFDFS